jgi:hypothetical protein
MLIGVVIILFMLVVEADAQAIMEFKHEGRVAQAAEAEP